MGATANAISRKLDELSNTVIELRAMLAALEITDAADAPERHRTGWRFVRGTHSGSYIRDPDGTDRLPAGHQQ